MLPLWVVGEALAGGEGGARGAAVLPCVRGEDLELVGRARKAWSWGYACT